MARPKGFKEREQISFTLEREMKLDIQRAADSMEIDQGALIRLALRAYLARLGEVDEERLKSLTCRCGLTKTYGSKTCFECYSAGLTL